MGRPRKEKAVRRLDPIPVRFTHEESELLRDQARAAGITRSELIRRRALGQRVQPLARRSDASMINELNRIGVNVNQLTRAVHTDRDFVRYWQMIGAKLEAVLEKVVREHGS